MDVAGYSGRLIIFLHIEPTWIETEKIPGVIGYKMRSLRFIP